MRFLLIGVLGIFAALNGYYVFSGTGGPLNVVAFMLDVAMITFLLPLSGNDS